MLKWLERVSNMTVGSGLTLALASFLGGDALAYHASMGGLYCNVPLIAAGSLLALVGFEPRAYLMYLKAKQTSIVSD